MWDCHSVREMAAKILFGRKQRHRPKKLEQVKAQQLIWKAFPHKYTKYKVKELKWQNWNLED